MKSTICAACLALWIVPAAVAAEHTTDSIATIKKNVNEKKAVIVDVREKSEWDEGHLKDAKLVPLSRLKRGVDPKALAQELPKEKIIYCHCRSGRRALEAGEILKQLGYDVRPLKQGFQDLIEAGLPKAK
jgi:rhodanese-related sulfurtransferase